MTTTRSTKTQWGARPRHATRRVTPRRAGLAIALVAGALLAACGDDGDSRSEPAVDGTSWVLDPASLDVDVPAAVEVTIAFDGDTVSGSSGCNSYTGTYTIDGTTLTLSPLASTLMACVPEVGDVEFEYLTTMGEVASIWIDDDELVLGDASETELLRYTPA